MVKSRTYLDGASVTAVLRLQESTEPTHLREEKEILEKRRYAAAHEMSLLVDYGTMWW